MQLCLAWPVALILSGQSSICIQPLCAPASQNSNSSAFSLHGVALCVLHKILQTPQFIWVEQLQVCMQQCPISPHFLWTGQSCVRIPQCFPSSALSPGGGVPTCGCSPHLVCKAAHSKLTGSISKWKGPLYACCGTLLFLLDLALGGVAGDALSSL